MDKNTETELALLAAKKDEETDLSDIPEMLDWDDAQRAKFYTARG